MISSDLACHPFLEMKRSHPLRINRSGIPTALLLSTLLLSTLPGQAHAAAAGSYPERTVRVAIPMAPGGPVDLTARMVAQRLSARLGQPVIVENRAGAGGAIAPTFVANSPPDGHVLLFMSKSSLLSKLVMDTGSGYDMLKELWPITQTDSQETILVTNNTVPAQTLKDLIALARARPGKLSYASNGVGSGNHLNIELFKSMAGIDMLAVPYKGSPQILVDLVAGRIDVYFSNAAAALPLVKSGKLRLLAITSAKRDASLPDVPTVSEAGVPGYEATSWFGMYAPAKTSADIVGRLSADIARVIVMSDVRKLFTASALTAQSSTPAEFTAFNRRELEKWTKVVKESGATVE